MDSDPYAPAKAAILKKADAIAAGPPSIDDATLVELQAITQELRKLNKLLLQFPGGGFSEAAKRVDHHMKRALARMKSLILKKADAIAAGPPSIDDATVPELYATRQQLDKLYELLLEVPGGGFSKAAERVDHHMMRAFNRIKSLEAEAQAHKQEGRSKL